MQNMKQKIIESSAAISLALFLLLIFQWAHEAGDKEVEIFESHSPEILADRLDDFEQRFGEALIRIPTGVFVQSIYFENPVVFNVTGYLWQKWGSDLPSHLEPGFVLPERINTAGSYTEELVYQQELADGSTLFGWYFETNVRQSMDYSEFPFDHKRLEIRILPKQFQSQAVLTPDFDAYVLEDFSDSAFGVDERLILDGYSLTDTFFDYIKVSYDTDFGFPDYVGIKDFPELVFNIDLQRNIANAFVIYLFPIIVVLILLFGTMLTVTNDPLKRERMDFSMNMVIASCSALFFILILSHVELRSRFIAAPIVYIEYFYIISYVSIFYVALTSYLFLEHTPSRFSRLLAYEDNLYAKAFFWPMLLAIVNLFTFLIIFE